MANNKRYSSYKLAKRMPGGDKLTGFTRILHRTKDDAVVGEVRKRRRLRPGDSNTKHNSVQRTTTHSTAHSNTIHL